MFLRRTFLAMAAMLFAGGHAFADPPPQQMPPPDLADTVAGVYSGDVISDARGSSKKNVQMVVTKIGPNTVRVESSYKRLPAFDVKLTQAMNTIQQAGGNTVFLYDMGKRPVDVHITVDDAAWQGKRTSGPIKAAPAPAPVQPKPDLADLAQGVYFGDVISDARGSSRSDVTITVTKVGPNMVQVSSDYPRIPSYTTRLTRAMKTIQNVGGPAGRVFLLDFGKSPQHLDITEADASWSGERTR